MSKKWLRASVGLCVLVPMVNAVGLNDEELGRYAAANGTGINYEEIKLYAEYHGTPWKGGLNFEGLAACARGYCVDCGKAFGSNLPPDQAALAIAKDEGIRIPPIYCDNETLLLIYLMFQHDLGFPDRLKVLDLLERISGDLGS